MAAAKPAAPPFRVNMERIQIPRVKLGGAGRNNPSNQLPVDSPPPRPAHEVTLTSPKDDSTQQTAGGQNTKEGTQRVVAPKIVVVQSPPPEPAIDYD